MSQEVVLCRNKDGLESLKGFYYVVGLSGFIYWKR